jgi:hypothetical protein
LLALRSGGNEYPIEPLGLKKPRALPWAEHSQPFGLKKPDGENTAPRMATEHLAH